MSNACLRCWHSHFLIAEDQVICLHPKVAETSQVTGKPIGMDANAVRHSEHVLGQERCGPSGRWYRSKNA